VNSLPEGLRREFGRRATGLALALAIELLLLLALLSLGLSKVPPKEPRLTEVDLTAHDYAQAAPEKPAPDKSQPRPDDRPAPQPTAAVVPVLQPPPPAAIIPLPTAPPAPPPTPRPRQAPPVSGPVYGPPDTGSRASGDSVVVGTAPNGEPLYAARWYREPGDEIDGYLSTASPGWGMIACRTIPNYYVTDCVALGETPGSMLTRAMLAASGQFLVRPARLGGRSLVGSWVRIKLDYEERRE
jgi:protein TonB